MKGTMDGCKMFQNVVEFVYFFTHLQISFCIEFACSIIKCGLPNVIMGFFHTTNPNPRNSVVSFN
jgi:hypothetical protein